MIIDIIEKVSENEEAMIVRPADTKDLAICQKELSEYSMPSLPADYIEFLKICNGYAFNGVYFYSTDMVTDPETDFTLDDIVSINDYNDYRDLGNKLIVGRSDEDLYVYDADNQKYEILDYTSSDTMEEYNSFEELFKEVVGPRI